MEIELEEPVLCGCCEEWVELQSCRECYDCGELVCNNCFCGRVCERCYPDYRGI